MKRYSVDITSDVESSIRQAFFYIHERPRPSSCLSPLGTRQADAASRIDRFLRVFFRISPPKATINKALPSRIRCHMLAHTLATNRVGQLPTTPFSPQERRSPPPVSHSEVKRSSGQMWPNRACNRALTYVHTSTTRERVNEFHPPQTRWIGCILVRKSQATWHVVWRADFS